MNFDAFVKDITDNNWNVFGAELYSHGELIRSFGDTEGLHDLYSMTKTVLSVAFGIENYEYKRSPEGYFYGASGMRLSVHDVSKFGLLLKNGGIYNGVRILSEEYARMATSIQQMNREGGYGFFIWKYRSGFSINGKCKQKCYILPDKDLVLCYLSYIDDDSHDLVLSAEKHILT